VSFAHRQADGFARVIPLANRPEFRQCRHLSLDDVPPLTDAAKVADVTPFSVRYEDGLQAWCVDRFDKTVIRAYREYRNESDVDAGAFPIVAFYNDGKGQL
jgi:hypothetical protein